VRPLESDVHVEVDPSRSTAFRGEVALRLELDRKKRSIRLHAQDLRVTKARIECADAVLKGRVTPLPGVEMIEIAFEASVPAGEATLHLHFAGKLRKDLCGLYTASSDKERYAFTQLEATDARKFFPCFDEPAMKARFQMSVTTAASNAVVSNAPIARTRRLPGGRKRVDFERTPLLSSYLLALAVGKLERSRPLHVGPTEIRVWHAPGKGSLTSFGLEAAAECLARLEHWFGLPYPYAKLDLVAVPDFEFGAMENAGAVFFRETLLLLDPATATLAEKKRAAEVIAHELAHMWYGDLVTMAWWDDLWLNEAFATWMAFQVVDDWKPEWKMWHDFQHGRAAALELDALRHTHPIYCPVRTASEANENFDLITYEKGASVVRMIERYLGPATFRRGVRRYIRRHREGNTVADDLWRALSEASGEPVEKLARAWIEQPGHPVVEIRRARDGRSLELAQERFFQTPRRTKPAERWPVPWVGRVGGQRGRGRLERRLLTRARERVPLESGKPRFVYGNADEGGFFRPLHSESELAALLGSLARLSPVERMGLVDHQWALVRAGRVGIASLLDLVVALAEEPDPDVLTALHKPLAFLADGLVPDAAAGCEAAFRSLLAEHFGAAFDEVGWERQRGESDDTGLRRAALLSIAGGIAGREDLLSQASERCDRYLAKRRSIDANLADGVVNLAARVGDSSRHRDFVAAMKAAATPQEHRRFLLALGAFRSPTLSDRSLELALGRSVATQDVVFLLARLLSNPASRERSWRFVRRRWKQLERRVPPLLASRLVETTWWLLTPERRAEVARHFRDHPLPAGERALRQTLERFDWYKGFRRGAARDLRAWLVDAGRL
jgi:puromycin-sensitive aminopeptidase